MGLEDGILPAGFRSGVRRGLWAKPPEAENQCVKGAYNIMLL